MAFGVFIIGWLACGIPNGEARVAKQALRGLPSRKHAVVRGHGAALVTSHLPMTHVFGARSPWIEHGRVLTFSIYTAQIAHNPTQPNHRSL
jgi:hypothetical protein